jgi:PAS domain S-box-containing protein
MLRLGTVLEAGRAGFVCDTRLTGADGEPVDVHVSVRAQRTAEGDVQHLALLVQDISQRKAAERALRRSEEVFRTLAENVPGVVYLCRNDERYTMLFLSDAVERLTGLPKEDFLEDRVSFVELFHPEDAARIAPEVDACVAQKESFHLRYRLRHADGDWRWIEEHGQGVFDEDGALQFLEGTLFDVTDRVEAEDRRRRMDAQLLQTQKLESLGVLAGGIAHDFNNLLTAVLGNASLALGHLDEPESAERSIQRIVAAAERAANLTREMLAYSGSGVFAARPLDVAGQVREIGHLLTSSVSKKVALDVQLAEDLPAVHADAAQLQQLILNLVLNGAEAVGDAVGTVRVRARSERAGPSTAPHRYPGGELRQGRYVVIEVQDDGEGISDATLARVFDPFFTTKFTGRGLGLATVLGIVRGHGGAIRVVTGPGRGTTFRVYLPAGADQRPTTAEIPAAELTGEGRILVVDDERMVRETAASILREYGYSVLTAEDGPSALREYRACADGIDLVVLDMTMPHMDGVETFHALRDVDARVRVLLSSGYTETAAARRFRSSGELAGFVQKPYSPKRLARSVKDALGRTPG